MRDQIIHHLNNPYQLECLYRENKSEFRKSFKLAYDDIKENITAQVWHERLNFKQHEVNTENKKELLVVVILVIIAGFIAKLPDILHLQPDYFYQRNIGFIVFPFLSAFFIRKNNDNIHKRFLILASLLVFVVYINLLPKNNSSDTLILACIHLQFMLWLMLGFSFTGREFSNHEKRMNFLRYNGDLVVMSAIIILAGSLFSGITIGLFSIIRIDISEFFSKYVIVWGLPAVPLIATYLIQNNPQLVNKVSPIIAKVFTPLVLIMLCVYLPALLSSDKDPYQDRDFLIIFNVLLIGVLALIFFSISEHTKSVISKTNTILLFSLTSITIIINCIALSAIIFRIVEWGFTPNRLAVMGGNLVILINLLLIAYGLFRSFTKDENIELVEKRITGYLPLYGLWAGVVTFLFPLIFKFA